MSVVQWLQRAGEYQLAEQLGFNGVVATYKGFQPDTKMFVCVGALDRDEMSDSPGWPRFCREFATIQNAPASRIVRGIKYGEENRFYWAAYEFMMRGRHLGHIVQESGLPPAAQAYDLMAQAVEALITLHGFGIPHRIVTPATIFINDIQQVKLLYSAWTSLILNVKGGAAHPNFMSNLPFLAPEICAGREGDLASDVYSVGANLYFLLTGQPTHWTDDSRELARLIATTPVDMTPLYQIMRGPAAEVIEEMLELDPADRPLNLEALHQRLISVAESLDQPAPAATSIQKDFETLDIPEEPQPETVVPPPLPDEVAPDPATEPNALSPDTVEEEVVHEPVPIPLPEEEEEQAKPKRHPPPPVVPETSSAISLKPILDEEEKAAKRKAGKLHKTILALWIFVGLLFIISAGGWLFFAYGRELLGGEEQVAAQPVSIPKPVSPAAGNVTKERLEKLGALHRAHITAYGIWATSFDQLRGQFEQQQETVENAVPEPVEETPADGAGQDAFAQLIVDGWETPFDLRGAFIVSAGVDKEWDTDDDLWFDAEVMELGGDV